MLTVSPALPSLDPQVTVRCPQGSDRSRQQLRVSGGLSVRRSAAKARKVSGKGITMSSSSAGDVQTLVIPGCAPLGRRGNSRGTLAALTAFLAPYRDGTGAAHNPQDA